MPVVMASCCSEARRAADVAGGDLGYVGRSDHRGQADAEPAHQAPENQVPDAEREPGADGADEEQQRAKLHGGDPAVAVGDLAGQVGACRAAEEGHGHGEAGDGLAERELVLDRVDGAVDDGGVKAEEEAADGARHGQPNDPFRDLGGGLVLGDGHTAPLAVRGPRPSPQLPSLASDPACCLSQSPESETKHTLCPCHRPCLPGPFPGPGFAARRRRQAVEKTACRDVIQPSERP